HYRESAIPRVGFAPTEKGLKFGLFPMSLPPRATFSSVYDEDTNKLAIEPNPSNLLLFVESHQMVFSSLAETRVFQFGEARAKGLPGQPGFDTELITNYRP